MKEDIKPKLVEARDQKLALITKFFSDKALEGHTLGSLSEGRGDAFSDIDIWFTFDDKEILQIIDRRLEMYAELGSIVMYHEAQQNFPLGGNYSLIIYETPAGLLQVDYYLCPMSSSRIVPGSTVLFERVKVERGEMLHDPKRVKKEYSDKVSFVICMCFVAIKKIVRGDAMFIDFLVKEYTDIKQRMFTELPEVANVNSTKTLKEVLENLHLVSTLEQQVGIRHIQKFIETVGI